MYVDSHCHLNFPDLAPRLPEILDAMAVNQVGHALVVSVTLDEWPGLMDLVRQHDHLHASVGVHPDYEGIDEPSLRDLLDRAADPKVVAIGETGLDYYRLSEPLDWQRSRFRTHIQASRESGLPLIIHTRSSIDDTLRVMREEHADNGVMHCFTESWAAAQAAMDLGFYISFSGIVTFKNATIVQEVAQKTPLDLMLIETDSPYLAPVPYRGKTNDPSKVVHVAEKIAELRGVPLSTIEQATHDNFFRLFKKIGETQ